MKFKKQALYLKTNIKKLLQLRNSLPLFLIVMVPIFLNSGITLSLIKYFSLSSNRSTDEYIVKQSQNKTKEQRSLHPHKYSGNQKINGNWNAINIAFQSKLVDFQNKIYSERKKYYLTYLLFSTLLGIGSYIYLICILSYVNKKSFKIVKKNNKPKIDEIAVAQPKVYDKNLEQMVDRQQKTEQDNKIAFHCFTNSLLADMGHELRSPLNAILGFTQIMQKESSLTLLQLENIMIINNSGNRMLSTINDLVDLSKIEIGRPILEENSFDFYFWLDKIERKLRHKAHSKGLEISLVRHSSLPKYIQADEKRLSQIVTNLIDYLLSHIQTGCVTVKVSCNSHHNNFAPNIPTKNRSSNRQEIVFAIGSADFSISPSEFVNLFSPAASIHQKGNYHGSSSLCLPISRRLAQLMGGDIDIAEDYSSKGNIVDFRLNIKAQIVTNREVQIQSTPRKVTGLASEQSKHRILVVDDSKTNRKIMVQLLEKVGFEIREAVNGKEAVDVWLRWQPHMIWMDIQMPVMNGYEATNQIKSDSKFASPPIVAISASNLEEERSLFQASRCDDFVAKPFSEAIIFDKIAQHLGVRYVYQSTSTSTSSDSIKSTSDVLTEIMPREWLKRLEQAALALDANLLAQLLQEIPAHHSSLKNVLELQVKNFDFDKIINLAQQDIDIKTKNIR